MPERVTPSTSPCRVPGIVVEVTQCRYGTLAPASGGTRICRTAGLSDRRPGDCPALPLKVGHRSSDVRVSRLPHVGRPVAAPLPR